MIDFLANAWQRSSIGRRYATLARRERALTTLCGAVVGGTLLYAAVISPIVDFRRDAVDDYVAELANLTWMQENQQNARARLRDNDAGTQVQVSTINSVANEFGLPLRRFQPESGGFSVQIEAQSFESIIRWTHALENRHGIVVQNASVDLFDEGLVNARFSLR